jgi:hypothetical protein
MVYLLKLVDRDCSFRGEVGIANAVQMDAAARSKLKHT